jgi:hypothetical protein
LALRLLKEREEGNVEASLYPPHLQLKKFDHCHHLLLRNPIRVGERLVAMLPLTASWAAVPAGIK